MVLTFPATAPRCAWPNHFGGKAIIFWAAATAGLVPCLVGCDGETQGRLADRAGTTARAVREQAWAAADHFGFAPPIDPIDDPKPAVQFVSMTYSGSIIDAAAARAIDDNGLGVAFPGLVSLDGDAAAVLGRIKGALRFDMLPRIDHEVAVGLACHEGPLCLDAVVAIDSEAARHLAGNAGTLALNGLSAIDGEIAAALSNHVGLLLLNGLKTLPPEVAAPLAGHRGAISLNGVTHISTAAATHLASLQHGLSLAGLTTIDDETALALSRHAGGQLNLDALTDASDAAVAALERHPKGVSLFNLKLARARRAGVR